MVAVWIGVAYRPGEGCGEPGCSFPLTYSSLLITDLTACLLVLGTSTVGPWRATARLQELLPTSAGAARSSAGTPPPLSHPQVPGKTCGLALADLGTHCGIAVR